MPLHPDNQFAPLFNPRLYLFSKNSPLPLFDPYPDIILRPRFHPKTPISSQNLDSILVPITAGPIITRIHSNACCDVTCFRLLPVSAALPESLDGSVTDMTSDEVPFVVAVSIVVAVFAESKSCDAELFWTKGSDWLFDVDDSEGIFGVGWCWFKRLTDAFRNERLKLADRRRILSRKLRGSSDKINSSDAYIGLWHKG